ncbi:MAG: LuxR C-terminal-related transcriptional regulator [Thermodesulfovibrionales bacterium]|nr:LuxR C-terminal-related transcriptional regulator [Thermodesulfovibrionales bacterium]
MSNKVINLHQSLKECSNAFIIFSPFDVNKNETIYYTEEAYKIIIAYKAKKITDQKIHPSVITSVCLKWHKEIEKKLLKNIKKSSNLSMPINIDLIQSYRRKYLVKALLLFNYNFDKNPKSCLFILERVSTINVNLIKLIREYRLTKREQDILHFLIEGFSNKQIAYELKLSLNTIKTYVKILMNKFNVCSRASIVAEIIKKGASN